MDGISELFYEDIEPNNAAIETSNPSQIATDTSWNLELSIENGKQPQKSGYKYRSICEPIQQHQISIRSDDRKACPTVKFKNINKELLQPYESIKLEVSLSTLLFKTHPYLLQSNSKNRLNLSRKELFELNNDRNMYRYYYTVDLDKCECVIDGLNIIQIPEYMIKEAIERDLYKKQQQMGKDFRDPVNFLAETQIKKLGDLNQSRLKLQLVLFNDKNIEIVKYLTAPIYSEPIEDTKSEMLAKKTTQNYVFSSTLRIIRSSKVIGYMGGNDTLMLFTSELEDTFNLEVEFYQVENNKRIWEERIKLKPDDITNKCTIVFKTPKYNEQLLIDKKARTPNTSNNHMINYKYLIKDHPVKVFFRLCQVDKKQFSEEWPFYYAKARCNILNHFHLNHLAEIYKQLKFDDGDNVMKDRNLQNEDDDEDQNSECISDDEDYSDDDDDESTSEDSSEEEVKSNKSSSNPIANRSNTSNTSSTKTLTTSQNQKSGQSASIKEDGGTQAVRLLVLDRKKKMNALADRTAAALLEVARSRSVHKVLKTQRYLLNTQNRDGNTPLHLCLLNGNFDLLEIIVDCALTIPHYNIINVKNNYQLTPLLLAAHIGESEVCDFLLEANSSLTEVDLNGNNCFHIASKQRNLKLIIVLCNYIKKNVDKSSVINICNFEGETPLHLAVKHNAYDIVEELIYTHPCRLEERNKRNGMNALHYSATYNYLQVSRLMLEYTNKADEQRVNKLMPEFVDAQANNGCTPLHMAIANKNYLIVRLLLKYGANAFVQSLEFAHPKYEENKHTLNTFTFQTSSTTDSSSKMSTNNDSEKKSEDVKDIHSSQESQKYNNANNVLLRHNNDAYCYVGDDKMMLEVIRNEKYVPKSILNKIFKFEFDRKKEKLPVKKQKLCDEIVGKKDDNQEIDFIEHFENKIREFNPNFQFNRVIETTPLKRSATESYVASPGSIDSADDEGTETPEIKRTRKGVKELQIDE